MLPVNSKENAGRRFLSDRRALVAEEFQERGGPEDAKGKAALKCRPVP